MANKTLIINRILKNINDEIHTNDILYLFYKIY